MSLNQAFKLLDLILKNYYFALEINLKAVYLNMQNFAHLKLSFLHLNNSSQKDHHLQKLCLLLIIY